MAAARGTPRTRVRRRVAQRVGGAAGRVRGGRGYRDRLRRGQVALSTPSRGRAQHGDRVPVISSSPPVHAGFAGRAAVHHRTAAARRRTCYRGNCISRRILRSMPLTAGRPPVRRRARPPGLLRHGVASPPSAHADPDIRVEPATCRCPSLVASVESTSRCGLDMTTASRPVPARSAPPAGPPPPGSPRGYQLRCAARRPSTA